MNTQEGHDYICRYFAELFDRRNVDALDQYLSESYLDDDIGDPDVDQIQNSKEYLRQLFETTPSIRVEVKASHTYDDVISAHLEWIITEDGNPRVIRKGVASFVVRDQKIVRRHTFVFAEE